ncbi:MAG: hypothetical protein M0C28_36715 [Candidatus Moduliflexus flocculans]|nr:hypothetical protein [Candidatus Moduliflexus flocculans]
MDLVPEVKIIRPPRRRSAGSKPWKSLLKPRHLPLMQHLKLEAPAETAPRSLVHTPSDHDITSSFPFDGVLVMFRLS